MFSRGISSENLYEIHIQLLLQFFNYLICLAPSFSSPGFLTNAAFGLTLNVDGYWHPAFGSGKRQGSLNMDELDGRTRKRAMATEGKGCHRQRTRPRMYRTPWINADDLALMKRTIRPVKINIRSSIMANGETGGAAIKMAPREGFEPPTRWLTATCSAD